MSAVDPAGLVEDADRAVVAGQIDQAIALLEQAAQAGAADLALWLKIAALNRATGKFRQSLEAAHRALELEPLDFTALLLRASLLQRLGDAGAGEAWGNALAQKPEGEMPPQLAVIVAEGERHHRAWLDVRAARMEAATAAARAAANDEQNKRIARFQSNVLRRTPVYHSAATHFHYPELTEREFHPRRLFPWLERLEAVTDLVRDELSQVLAAERTELVPYIQYDDHLPLDQWRPLNRNKDWTAIHLLRNGERVDANARHCPQLMNLLAELPQPQVAGAGPNAMFSLLAPNTHIPPHVGVNNTRLVCHLPLIVPPGCWFRVGAETREWRRGEAFVFDDTIEHEAMNPTDQLRVILIFDVWHPDLTPGERDAVAALVGAEHAPAPL